VQDVAPERAPVIVCDGNFHGRTTTIVGFSSDPTARAHFGPFMPGFVRVPFGDAEAVGRAVDDTTAAVLVEPIQGEAGVTEADLDWAIGEISDTIGSFGRGLP
jgi:ornithine--oxo-acid transaminase